MICVRLANALRVTDGKILLTPLLRNMHKYKFFIKRVSFSERCLTTLKEPESSECEKRNELPKGNEYGHGSKCNKN